MRPTYNSQPINCFKTKQHGFPGDSTNAVKLIAGIKQCHKPDKTRIADQGRDREIGSPDQIAANGSVWVYGALG
ncbi:MAG: hypothetical protein PHR16_04395 [Methylovulum sp.]|nr:hypothetical protein [Methylovulum sp.]